MGDLLTMEEIEALIDDTDNTEEIMYTNMSTEDFAICIIQKVHENITDDIKAFAKVPTQDDICRYHYEATSMLLNYLKDRNDVDEILAIVNEHSSSYRCKIKLYISPLDGELKIY